MTILSIRRILFISMLYSASTWSANVLVTDYWKCSAYDKLDQQWVAKSPYERTATNKALEACKKQSKAPESCKIAKEYCESIVNGVSTQPMWQCLALDLMSKQWRSNFYPQPDDAALAAKAYCQQHSGMPDTCYVNLLTCKNLNPNN